MGTIDDKKKKKKKTARTQSPCVCFCKSFQICFQKAAAERRNVIAI